MGLARPNVFNPCSIQLVLIWTAVMHNNLCIMSKDKVTVIIKLKPLM